MILFCLSNSFIESVLDGRSGSQEQTSPRVLLAQVGSSISDLPIELKFALGQKKSSKIRHVKLSRNVDCLSTVHMTASQEDRSSCVLPFEPSANRGV